MDRAAQVLFGLIMILTFTCSISIAKTHRSEVRYFLYGAVGSNLAWGIVDATMYLIGLLARRNRDKLILDSVRNAVESDKAREYIANALPPLVASVLDTSELEDVRQKLQQLPDTTGKVRLTLLDIKKAIAIFLMTCISTFPVVAPFLFIPNSMLALRVSNAIAIVMMLLCGWSVAKYVGFNKWIMSVAIALIGIILVAITIALEE